MIDDEDFDFDQPVTRIPQNAQSKKLLNNNILNEAEQYLESISENEHALLMTTLASHAEVEPYFNVLADELNQPVGSKVANDALHLLYFWRLISQQKNPSEPQLLDVINTDIFQTELFKAFDDLDIGEIKEQRRKVLLEALELYKLNLYAGCIAVLYAQLEGTLTDVLIQTGFLKQNGTKFIDVYKIVPGLKGNEIKSLWHKSKIATEQNLYFSELAAYKMDSSSTVSMSRHNILHGTDMNHLNQQRSFILFIWLFAAIRFMSNVK